MSTMPMLESISACITSQKETRGKLNDNCWNFSNAGKEINLMIIK